jgi:hypothetical protein
MQVRDLGVDMRALGLRVKSGSAIAVIVEGDARSWCVTRREEILLTAPTGEYARFPYHPLLELDSEAGAEASLAAVATIRSESRRRLAATLGMFGAIDAAGVVAGSLVDPQTLGNLHMRAHAREGQLFRDVVIDALDRAQIPHEVLRDKDSYAQASARLQLTETALRNELKVKGRVVVKPWRADEKLATLGSLYVLGKCLCRDRR